MNKLLFVFCLMLIICMNLSAQDDIQQVFNSGVKSLKQKNYQDAILSFNDVLEFSKQRDVQKMAYIYRGFAKRGLEKYTDAIKDIDKAIELDSSDLSSFIDRAETWTMIQNYDAAKNDFLYVLTIDSVSAVAVTAYYYLGIFASQNNDYDMSIAYYTKLITINPNMPEAFFNRAAAKGMIMDSEGAIADYDKAIALKPDYMEAFANRGFSKINLLTGKGKIKPSLDETADACSDLKKAKELGDSSVDDMIYLFCTQK